MTNNGIYVCFKDYGYDGNTEPLAVFRKEIDAKRWVKFTDYGCYEFLEIKNKFEIEVEP